MSIAVDEFAGRLRSCQHEREAAQIAASRGSSRLSSTTLTIVVVLLLLGLFLRGRQFYLPRSLWMDESFLALNIIDRDFVELAGPLDYEQGAPLGFLWGTKGSTILFGENARAIRLMSLLMGSLALGLFFPVARQFVSAATALVALGLFAILPPMIYYSAELKPYSADVAMCLLILLFAVRVQREPARWGNWLWLGAVGAAAIWLSFPAVFVLAGVGIVLGCQPILYGTGSNRWPVLTMGAAWLLSFAGHYQLCMKHLASHNGLRVWWHNYYHAYLPLPPNQFDDFKWFLDKGLGVFADPVGLSTAGIALVCFLAGLQSLAARSRLRLALLLAPMLVVLLASGFEKYPFANRMILFLTPLLVILVAEGARHIREPGRALGAVGMAVLLLLFVHPALAVVDQVKRGEAYSNPIIPNTVEEIEPLMAYLNSNWRPGDKILVFRESQFAYRFYARQLGMQDRPFQVLNSHEPWNVEQQSQFDELPGHPRVWLVFSRTEGLTGHDHEPLLMIFDRLGKRRNEVRGRGPAFLVLYDFRTDH